MKKYKHYSFDLWLTLIKSDLAFKKKRAEYFFEHFNRDKKTLEEVESIIKEIDIMCNVVNEKVGFNIDALEMYAMVLHRLNYDFKHFQQRDLISIYHITEQMFFQHPPTLFDDNTKMVLAKIKEQGHTISILSNTAFTRGSTLKKLLINLQVYQYFDFILFSDEVGMSKPNEQLFRNMINLVHATRKQHPVLDSEIIHIGDSQIADIDGANKAGIASFLINSNDKTIKDILD